MSVGAHQALPLPWGDWELIPIPTPSQVHNPQSQSPTLPSTGTFHPQPCPLPGKLLSTRGAPTSSSSSLLHSTPSPPPSKFVLIQ